MRYFLGFLVTIGLIVLVFVLILRGFSGGGDKPVQKKLTDYANTNTVMELTIDGPINADSEHRGIRVSVGRSQNRIEIYQGYQNTIIDSRSYESNQESYTTFLRALDLLGYSKGEPDPAKRDERGFCPARNRFIYAIVSGGEETQHYWNTSCGQGTFQGDAPRVRNLFQQQIPDYGPLTNYHQVR